MKRLDVAILGAGASGMVASILLARRGFRILLIEKEDRGGKKILISGNGRCNITNKSISKSNFYGNNYQLIESLLKEYSFNDIVSFFKTIGLELKSSKDGRVFPLSLQASSVLKLLEKEIERLKIETIYNAKSIKVSKGFNIEIENMLYKTSNLIIATGSKAAPQVGGSDSGLNIAKEFKHSIIEPLPALTPLYSSNPICKEANGVKVAVNLKLFVTNHQITSKKGDLLFTKYGISGLSVLDISIDVTKAIRDKRDFYLEIDFFDEFNKKDFIKFLKNRIDKSRNLPLYLWLNSILNSKITKHILKSLNMLNSSEKDLNSTSIKSLANRLKRYKIDIEGLREFKYSEVAIGGVNSKEIDFDMQSKKVKNLYFIGEVLDIIGDRGGYNFTFAWFSAFRVASKLKA